MHLNLPDNHAPSPATINASSLYASLLKLNTHCQFSAKSGNYHNLSVLSLATLLQHFLSLETIHTNMYIRNAEYAHLEGPTLTEIWAYFDTPFSEQCPDTWLQRWDPKLLYTSVPNKFQLGIRVCTRGIELTVVRLSVDGGGLGALFCIPWPQISFHRTLRMNFTQRCQITGSEMKLRYSRKFYFHVSDFESSKCLVSSISRFDCKRQTATAPKEHSYLKLAWDVELR